MVKLAMLVLPGTFHTGVAALLDGYALASERRQRIIHDDAGNSADMSLTVLSRDGGAVELDGYTSVNVDGPIALADRYDFVWIPNFRSGGSEALSERLKDARPVVEWLKVQAESGALLGASGSSIALLLAAGLVKGIGFPVMPALVATFRELFPRIRQEDHREIVEAGNVLLGRGSSGDIELIARVFDRVLSPATGHWLRSVMGQTVETRDHVARDPLVESARLWLEQRFADEVSIARLADELNVSHAVLSRRFKAELGCSPAEFVGNLRFTTAKRMLAQSNRTIESIAAAVGYGDARNFREAFRRRAGVSASEWRRRQK